MSVKSSVLPKYVLLPLFLVVAIIIAVVFRKEIALFQSDVTVIREWLLARHGQAFLIFIALQILQVVIFVLPGEFVQIAGGYVFGIVLASLYSYLGMLIGGTICALVTRYSGTSIVHRIIGSTRYRKMATTLSSRRAIGVFFLLFLIPGVPKDILYYVGGLSQIPLWFFISVTSLARLPGIVGASIIGVLIYTQNWMPLIILVVVALIIVAVGIIFRTRITKWVDRALGL